MATDPKRLPPQAALAAGAARCQWKASEVAVVRGFDAPECALADAAWGKVYVGNMLRG